MQVILEKKLNEKIAKKSELYYTVFLTSEGYAGLIADKGGIIKFYLPEKFLNTVTNNIKRDFNSAKENNEYELLKTTKELLSAYFSGEKVSFENVKLNMKNLSPFTKNVYNVVKKISYGDVKTYKWVAERTNSKNAYKAVGNALHHNPFPVLIPCHRVVKSDGELGGFSSSINWKIKLLKIENIMK